MKVAIMQPYFFPYIGYFQLINAVDKFVVYDNIQYTKKGWFSRNRFLLNGKEKLFTIPIKKDSDFLDVRERELAGNSIKERKKILAQLENAYRKAPYFQETFQFLKPLFLQETQNLFQFIYNSIIEVTEKLEIDTNIIISSKLPIKHELKAEEKVIELCNYLKANTYINSIGGKELYRKEQFNENDIHLKFLQSNPIKYSQFKESFVPWLSIIDLFMFNGFSGTKKFLNEYQLI
jgi:hypothetical protein